MPNNFSKKSIIVPNMIEWRRSSSKLVRKAAIGPDVYRLAVEKTRDDFGSDPVRRSLDRLTLLLLLGKTASESEIGDFDLALRRVQDVVRLNVPMKHIIVMHLLQAEQNFEKTVPAEILRVVAEVMLTNV